MRCHLMYGVLVVTLHRRLVRELHRYADVERSVHVRTRRGQRLTDREKFHFGYLARERVRRRNDSLAMLCIARFFQPDEADVVNLPR